MKNGATTSRRTMTAKAVTWCRPDTVSVSCTGGAVPLAVTILPVPAEETRGPHEEHEGHDDEDDGVGGFRVEHFGQPLDDAQREAGDDGARDGAHAADHHDREDHDDQIGAHERVDLVDGSGEYAGERGQGDPEAVRQRD